MPKFDTKTSQQDQENGKQVEWAKGGDPAISVALADFQEAAGDQSMRNAASNCFLRRQDIAMSRLSSLLSSLFGGPLSATRNPDGARWHGQLLPLASSDFPIAVCWSAKAGCTTVLKWFLEHHGLLQEANCFSPWVHDYREQRLCAGQGYRDRCERIFNVGRGDKYIVKVIRDPALRAVSGYLHLLRWGHSAEWPAGATVNRWKADAGLGGQRGLSFRQFLRFVIDHQRQGLVIDPHFRSQYEPLQDRCVDALVPLEQLAARLFDLEHRFRLPHVNIQPLSESMHHNPATDHSAWPDTPAEHPADASTLERFGTPSAQALLDNDTVDLVLDAYRADYVAYGSVYPSATATISMRIPLGAERGSSTLSPRGALRRAA